MVTCRDQKKVSPAHHLAPRRSLDVVCSLCEFECRILKLFCVLLYVCECFTCVSLACNTRRGQKWGLDPPELGFWFGDRVSLSEALAGL